MMKTGTPALRKHRDQVDKDARYVGTARRRLDDIHYIRWQLATLLDKSEEYQFDQADIQILTDMWRSAGGMYLKYLVTPPQSPKSKK